MSFNQGWLCKECGPAKEAINKAATKYLPQRHICKNCNAVVTKWERPLNEHVGRCSNCAGGEFTLALVKGQLIRCCKKCKQATNTDQKNKIIRKGDKKHEWKPRQ